MRQPVGSASSRETRRLADLAARPSGNPFTPITSPKIGATGQMVGNTWMPFGIFPMTFPMQLVITVKVPGQLPGNFPFQLMTLPDVGYDTLPDTFPLRLRQF